MSVEVHYEDELAWVRLDRPPLNLFDTAQQRQADAALRELRGATGVRAVVFTGAGGHFSAGGDIAEMGTLTPAQVADYAARISRLTREVAALPVPVIAAVRGYALGGGCELALAADIRICTPTARFGLPEIPLGLIPGAGGTQRLPRLIGLSRAKDILFSGRQVTATEAERIGLVDEIVPEDTLLDAARTRARRYTAGPPAALTAAKRATDASFEGPLDHGLDLELTLFTPLLTTGQRTPHFHRFQKPAHSQPDRQPTALA
ncbi:enoyl-CoA hydratase/isomerase family protein [Streptomyces sp. NPDC050535]|uniref:enoyl-CoA hydratase/isomerase family protein n=1 Tax=Streptomyces sp. NPDC050535 TaxID=3365626 RepID=UPI0037BA2014